MKWWKSILLIALLVAVSFCAWICVPIWRQPSYQGKRVGTWISQAISATRSSDRPKFRDAENAINKMGEKAVPYLTSGLRQKPTTQRDRIITFVLSNLKLSRDRRSRLVAVLQGWGSERSISARLLGAVGPKAAPAIPDLLAACTDSGPAVRTDAVTALGKIRADYRRVVPVLVTALKDSEAGVRANAAWALRQYGGEAAEAADALVEATYDRDSWVQLSAAQALGSVSRISHGPEAVSTLIRLLSSANQNTRLNVLVALGELGPSAKAAIPYLIEMRNDPNPSARTLAEGALAKIENSEPR